MNIRLFRIAWKNLEGEQTGTIVSTDWQGEDPSVKVWPDGCRTILTVYKRQVLALSDKLDHAFGNKPPTDRMWKPNWEQGGRL